MVNNQDKRCAQPGEKQHEAVQIQGWGGVGCGKRADQEVKGHRELRSTSAVALLLKTNNGSRLHTPFMAILDSSASAIPGPFLPYLPADAGTLAHLPPPDTSHRSRV